MSVRVDLEDVPEFRAAVDQARAKGSRIGQLRLALDYLDLRFGPDTLSLSGRMDLEAMDVDGLVSVLKHASTASSIDEAIADAKRARPTDRDDTTTKPPRGRNPWDEGYEAARNGRGEGDNPYDAKTERSDHHRWRSGWCDHNYQSGDENYCGGY